MTGWKSNLKLNLNRIRQRSAKVHPRDLIVSAMISLLLVVYVTKAMQFNFVGNLRVLANSMAIIGIVSIGQTLVVLTGGMDLSVGSLMALTGVLTAYLASMYFANWLGPITPWLAAIVSLAVAAAIGWLHGVLVTRFKLAPFIVTFGSLSLLRGLAQVISNASPINLHTPVFDWLLIYVFGVIPLPAILMAALLVTFAYVLHNTRLGRYTYAVGSNETVARLSGVNVERTQRMVYAMSGLLAGVAGLLVMASIDAGDFNSGANYELLSIAAVIIGGTSLKGGTGGMWGTLAGVLLITLVSKGLVLLSVPTIWKEAITGALIVMAALIDVQRRRIQESIPVPVRSLTAPPIEPSMTLDETLKQLARTIQEGFGYDEIRVYLRDRDTGSLLEPYSRAEPGGTLARNAGQNTSSSPKAIFLNDLHREQPPQAIPWHAEIRSAAAIPILHRKAVVGVIEIQSPILSAFSPQTLEAISRLAGQMAPTIEDRWLLEGGWLTQQIRECLRNLKDDVYLNHCALADWLQIKDLTRRSDLLRQVLWDGIEHIIPDAVMSNARSTRCYQVVKQTYIDDVSADTICQKLSLSRRQYFYDLKQGIDIIVDFLFTQRHNISLRYDMPSVRSEPGGS